MRDCEYYQELMSRLLDEGLSEEEEAALRAHVRVCPECLRMFSAFTGMTAALREDLAEPPEDLAPAVMAHIAGEERPSPRRRKAKAAQPSRRPQVWVRWAAAACLALMVAGVATVTARQSRMKSFQSESAGLRSAADAAWPDEQTAGSGDSAAEQPMTASAGDQQPAYSPQSGDAEAPAPAPEPEETAAPEDSQPEALTVYDAARNRIGTIDPANIPAFRALITDEGWAEGSFEYMLRVEYQQKTYAFAKDTDGGLIWWEEPSTQPLRSPGTFAQLHELITMETPALPQ